MIFGMQWNYWMAIFAGVMAVALWVSMIGLLYNPQEPQAVDAYDWLLAQATNNISFTIRESIGGIPQSDLSVLREVSKQNQKVRDTIAEAVRQHWSILTTEGQVQPEIEKLCALIVPMKHEAWKSIRKAIDDLIIVHRREKWMTTIPKLGRSGSKL